MTQYIWSGLLGLALSLVMGPMVLPLLRKWKFGQTIREEGPQRHLAKSGTPTMGGIVFILGALIPTAILAAKDYRLAIVVLSFVGFGAIGFIDDYIKVVLKRNLGLRAWQKIAFQLVLAIVISIIGYSKVGSTIMIPFVERSWDLGFWYIPFQVFVVLSFVNAVNLTDGLDGLAAGVSIFAFLIFLVMGLVFEWSTIGVFAAALVGALGGFLRINIHPAKVFMGDTGSMALGGGLCALIVLSGAPLVLLIGGGVFFLETLSVAIQVLYFKATKGKRIFKMTPIHHHFELSGWGEWKVVLVFWTAAALFGLLAIASVL
ncbi:phospho-N-acetylmuramoyl-pentapeptide-transferase [Alkalibacter rhizosphaerae]|uniref:Phospho-N-acetylmuramoyl-pentapeptide-transferase n=1 Tax=Alkalibacter rhizosphaerae TaxID=2815577 RepID=A0A974XFI8_9FIRM|nr:phospho-N-acetylmuramoyl-pentapeptide-transferase [Alkalibacter rhizosphaerae]QSX08922.1 phospho-N-acetylmuramoyl-pentapeptide-transferase [Alkalibacter rhizosphaerae]